MVKKHSDKGRTVKCQSELCTKPEKKALWLYKWNEDKERISEATVKWKGGQIKARLSMSPKEKEDLVTILYYVVVYKDIRSRVDRKNTSIEREHLLPSRGNTPGAEAHLQGVPEISSQVLKQTSAQKTQGLLIFHTGHVWRMGVCYWISYSSPDLRWISLDIFLKGSFPK